MFRILWTSAGVAFASRIQWAPTRTSHDPNPPITLETATATLTEVTMAAIAIGVATLATAKTIQQAIVATAVGVAGLTAALSFQISMAATAVGVATLSTLLQIAQLIAGVAVGVATLTTQFISGGSVNIPAFEWFKSITLRRRGRRR